ncbi:MAG TPA: tetratricopeptide repeat protein [Bryobacteraceae bacterium]|nr:tetratricopeptide repeat protein [Bryobacteraceae bacterium]
MRRSTRIDQPGKAVGKRTRRVTKPKQNRPATPTPSRPPAGKIHTPPFAGNRRLDLYICLLLLVLTLAIYSRVVHFDFLNYDDPEYVTENVHVRGGFTWAGVAWAFTSFHAANWSPVTWLSHMADCQLFGLRSGWHHCINVLLHAAAALLLFAALKKLTGARWPSAFVAFLFALHPLHVESVAWIAERKDVLCALFWFLALWFYARYAQRPGAARYALVLLAFCLGLMAKPMIVTLPFVLLLLDVWPLRRANRLAVLWEKAPFFLLAAGSAVVTVLAQEQGRAVKSLVAMPFGLRIENASVAYAAYIVRMLWPANLAVLYPYRHTLPVWQVLVAALALVAITVLTIRRARSQPYLAAGWFWYLGTLVPVIGLVQVGAQSSADRYTYVPTVGLAVMVAWGAADFLDRRPDARRAIAISAAAVCLACAGMTWFQLRYWADSGRLFQRAVDVTRDNYIAHNNLANYYLVHLRNDEAMEHISEALRIKPAYPEAHVNLALVLRRSGKFDAAEREYQTALRLQPASLDAYSGYGALLVAQGRMQEALRMFAAGVELEPEYADGHYDLGRVLASLGRTNEALAQFQETIRLRPDHVDARHTMGVILLTHGRLDDALAQFRAEAQLKPDDANVHYTVGTLLASAGRLDEAIAQFTEALRIKPDLDSARRGLESARAQRARLPLR